MEKYYCKSCDYATEVLFNFKAHIGTKKHALLCKTTLDPELCKVTIFECVFCNKKSLSRATHFRHMKACKKGNLPDKLDSKSDEKMEIKPLQTAENNQVISVLMDLVKTQQDMLKMYQSQQVTNATLMEKVVDVADKNADATKKSMNMLQYANKNILKSKPLKKLNNTEAYSLIGYDNPEKRITYEEYEKHAKTCVSKYNHGAFVSYVGDMIITHYKPSDKMEANIIATDVSRLSFIVLQKVDKDINKTKKEWINDKSGKRFISLILLPLLEAFKHTIVQYKKMVMDKKYSDKSTDEQMADMNMLTDCMKLKRDLENSKFTTQILKYVAPSFHFDAFEADTVDLDIDTDTFVDTFSETVSDFSTRSNNLNEFDEFDEFDEFSVVSETSQMSADSVMGKKINNSSNESVESYDMPRKKSKIQLSNKKKNKK